MKIRTLASFVCLALVAVSRMSAQSSEPHEIAFTFRYTTLPIFDGSFVTFVELVPRQYQLKDWRIKGPLGDLTPKNSKLISGKNGDITPSGYFISPTLIPLDQLNFQFDAGGNNVDVNFNNDLPGGTIEEAGSAAAQGTWVIPDRVSTGWLLVVGVVALLGAGMAVRRRIE